MIIELVRSHGYMAYEVVNHKDYNFEEIGPASDIWSFGVILWQMLNGPKSFPFELPIYESDRKYRLFSSTSLDENEMFWLCHAGARMLEKISNPNEIKSLKALFVSIFDNEPEDRATIADIRRNSWYKSLNGYNSAKDCFLFRTMVKKLLQKELINDIKFDITRYNYDNISSINEFGFNLNIKKLIRNFVAVESIVDGSQSAEYGIMRGS